MPFGAGGMEDMAMMDNPGMRSTSDMGDGGRRGGRESVIDQDCFFEGTFRTPGNMRIEGTYKGVIECQGTLLIAESGQVNARILAGNLLVSGQLTGEVQCETRFELLKTGRASGSITAKTTVVHEGAFFEGEVRMGRDAATPAVPQSQAIAAAPESLAQTVAARPPTASPAARRRASGDAAAVTADDTVPTTEDTEAVPRSNGRSQAARDVMPNRTGED